MTSPSSQKEAAGQALAASDDSRVQRITAHHERAVSALTEAVEAAIACGEELRAAKAEIEHGGWGDFIEALPFSQRTAQGYVQLADHAEEARRVAHLGIRGALKEIAAPRMPAPEALPPEPKREDYGDGHLESARFYLDLADYFDDRELAIYREVLANAAKLIADYPVAGSASVAKAATGIAFLTAHRVQQQTDDDEWDAAFEKTRTAWLNHRRARDAYYAAVGEPLMDERPADFFDAFYVLMPMCEAKFAEAAA